MATWISSGADVGGSGSYIAGTQSVQFCHDNFASDGDTVLVPNGTFNWSTGAVITKAITVGAQNPGNAFIQNQMATGYMLSLNSGTTGHIHLTGLNFKQIANNGGSAGNSCITCDRSDTSGAPGTNFTVIITNCLFDSGTIFVNMVLLAANGIIFSGCTFQTEVATLGLCGIKSVASKYGYLSASGTPGVPPGWSCPSTMGTLDTTGLNNTYVENCTFINGATSATDWDDNSRAVVRHCTFQDSQLANHGQDTSIYGLRHLEVYNNTFRNVNYTAINGQCWISLRGAVLLVNANTYDLPPAGKATIILEVQQIQRATHYSCQTAYPANRQVGSGWSAGSSVAYGNPAVTQDGVGYVLDPCYIWGDSGAGGPSYGSYIGLDSLPDDCGNGQLPSNYIQLNRDYFNGTARPGWTPFTYPHPLVPGGSTVSPNISGTISVTGSVVPTLNSVPGNGLTAAADLAIAKTILGVTSGAYVVPANNFVGLFSTQFTALAKAGAVEWLTSSDALYARQAMGAGGSGWTIAAYASGTGVIWNNTNRIPFPPVVGNAQTLFSLGFCDALTSGNINFFVDLVSGMPVPIGFAPALIATTGVVFTTL